MTDERSAKVIHLPYRKVMVPVVTVEYREAVALVDRKTMAILLANSHMSTVDRLADREELSRIYVGAKPCFDLADYDAFKARGGCRDLGK